MASGAGNGQASHPTNAIKLNDTHDTHVETRDTDTQASLLRAGAQGAVRRAKQANWEVCNADLPWQWPSKNPWCGSKCPGRFLAMMASARENPILGSAGRVRHRAQLDAKKTGSNWSERV